MITKYDVYRSFEKIEQEVQESNGQIPFQFKLDKENDVFVDKDTGEVACTVDQFLTSVRKSHHCDFEVIYSEHVSLTTIYRCKDCGAVIFAGDDERWDPRLECPSCGGYHTSLEWWSAKEIEEDPEKQKMIEFYIQMQKDMDEMYARVERRNGLHDWEIWKKKFRSKKSMLELNLVCLNLFSTGLKGLSLEVSYWGKENVEDLTYTRDKYIKIPLSPYAVYLKWLGYRMRNNPGLA